MFLENSKPYIDEFTFDSGRAIRKLFRARVPFEDIVSDLLQRRFLPVTGSSTRLQRLQLTRKDGGHMVLR